MLYASYNLFMHYVFNVVVYVAGDVPLPFLKLVFLHCPVWCRTVNYFFFSSFMSSGAWTDGRDFLNTLAFASP